MLKLALPSLIVLPMLLHAAHPSSVTLHASPATAEYGKPVTLTAAVSPAAATGTVTFYNGVTILEIEPVSSGKATLTTSLLPAGSNSLKAYYSGDSTYAPSTSAVVAETVKTAVARNIAAPVYSFNGNGEDFGFGVADFNGDGKQDFAVYISTGNESGFYIFLGNGDGTFESPVFYFSGGYYGGYTVPGTVAIGDFLGNGIADIFTEGTYDYEGQSSLFAFFGNGDGTFQAPVYTSVSATYPVIADFNGDGKADVAAICDTGQICVMLGNGAGVLGPTITSDGGQSPYALAVGDFNSDGKPDLVVTDYLGISILLGNGDGTFQPPIVINSDINYNSETSIVVADFNGDGKQDIATNGVYVFLGNGDGTFQPEIGYPAGAIQVAVCDFNADGKLDIISGNDLLLGNGDGTFQSPTLLNASNYGYLALADFNGDGRVDIAGSSGITLFVQLGTLAEPTTTSLASSPNPSYYGLAVTLTATISPSAGAGTVTFYNGATELGTAPVKNGTATLTTSTLPVGVAYLYADYSGDTYSQPSSGSASQTVTAAPTSTTLLSSPNPSTLGQTVNLIAQLTPITAVGNVQFSSGATVLGTSAVVNGKATFSISTLPEGEHLLTASFIGNTDYSPSVSFVVYQKVN